MYNRDEFNKIAEQATNKKAAERAKTAVSLIETLDKKSIEDDKLENMLKEWADALDKHSEGEKGTWSKAHKSYVSVINYVEQEHKLQPKGNIQAIYFTMFLCFGIIFGTVTNMGIGIAVGAGLGAAVGAAREKKAKEEGRLF